MLIASALGSYFVIWMNELCLKYIIDEILFLNYLLCKIYQLLMEFPNPNKRFYINEE